MPQKANGQKRNEQLMEFMDELPSISVAKSFASIMIKSVPLRISKTDPEFAKEVEGILKSKDFILSVKKIIDENGVEGLLDRTGNLGEEGPEKMIEFLTGIPQEVELEVEAERTPVVLEGDLPSLSFD